MGRLDAIVRLAAAAGALDADFGKLADAPSTSTGGLCSSLAT
jgi:hypothetical protein